VLTSPSVPQRGRVFDSLKRCAWKNAVRRCNKKSGESGYFYTNRKEVEKPHRFGRHRTKTGPNPNGLVFQEPMSRGKYECMGFWVKYAIGTISASLDFLRRNRRGVGSVTPPPYGTGPYPPPPTGRVRTPTYTCLETPQRQVFSRFEKIRVPFEIWVWGLTREIANDFSTLQFSTSCPHWTWKRTISEK